MIDRFLTTENRKYLRVLWYCIVAIILAGLALGVRDTRLVVDDTETMVQDELRPGVEELRVFLNASRESRIRFQATEKFFLCSRDFSTIVQPDLVDEVDKACDGYETPESALLKERQLQEEIQSRVERELAQQDPN